MVDENKWKGRFVSIRSVFGLVIKMKRKCVLTGVCIRRMSDLMIEVKSD